VRRLSAAAVIALVLGGAAACGSDQPVAPLAKVPVDLAPASVSAGTIKLYAKTDRATARAFADAGEKSLQADAKLWELRQGDRLVGALQITTVVPKLDLRKDKDRDSLLRQVMIGSVEQLAVGDLPVWVTSANDKVVYMWFGQGLFEVLQLKGSQLQPEQVLTDLVKFQEQTKAWEPLPPEVFEN
jgi:hypothetical protein